MTRSRNEEGQEGEEGKGAAQGEGEGTADPEGLPRGDALPQYPRRGAGHRLLQEGVRRKRGDAHARTGRQARPCRDRDRRLARNALRRIPGDAVHGARNARRHDGAPARVSQGRGQGGGARGGGRGEAHPPGREPVLRRPHGQRAGSVRPHLAPRDARRGHRAEGDEAPRRGEGEGRMTPPATLVLLPGLDGTEILLQPLLGSLPRAVRPLVVTYPVSGDNSYAELLALVRRA